MKKDDKFLKCRHCGVQKWLGHCLQSTEEKYAPKEGHCLWMKQKIDKKENSEKYREN